MLSTLNPREPLALLIVYLMGMNGGKISLEELRLLLSKALNREIDTRELLLDINLLKLVNVISMSKDAIVLTEKGRKLFEKLDQIGIISNNTKNLLNNIVKETRHRLCT